MINVEEYLPVLCDPISYEPLELEEDETGRPALVCYPSRMRYYFMGDFPDLRPDAGIPFDQVANPQTLAAKLDEKDEEVRRHYNDKPCNNYLNLDNVPLGRWLRDPAYASWFENLGFTVEVGAGKGAIALAFKKHRGIRLFCIDLAYGSLRQVRFEPLCADGALASNLHLPLRDGVADLVVSYGVIHHTPDPIQCMVELSRVLKPGGRLLLGVYNWDNLYRSLYFFFSPPFKAIRRLFGKTLGDLLLQLTVFVPYHLALWLVLATVQKRLTFPKLRDSWEQFSDFFLTPYARFYTREEMITLANILGLKLLEHATGGWPGNSFSHFYWFQKLLDP